MPAFIWDEHFVTGFGDIDDQHQFLVGLINRFYTMLAENQASYPELGSLVDELKAYCRFHFQQEEALMHASGLGDDYVLEHSLKHQSFLMDLQVRFDDVCDSELTGAHEFMDFLNHWLVYHILGEDQVMAARIRAIESGADTAQAPAAAIRAESAIEPLLAAMKGLIAEAATRNESLMALNSDLELAVQRQAEELVEARRSLERFVETDPLTGLPNRRSALERLSWQWMDAEARRRPLSCIILNIDGFGDLNRVLGHDAGDQILASLARGLRHATRSDDEVCRLGGDEFLIICPGADANGCRQVAEAIRQSVQDITDGEGANGWTACASLGSATRSPSIRNYRELLLLADQGLIEAKRLGGNRLCEGRCLFQPETDRFASNG